MVIVFDLDDTLYEELSFVRSGLGAVARYLQTQFGIPVKASNAYLLERLSKGRAGILDDLLSHFSIFSQKNVRKCLTVYRLHRANIHLYPEADEILDKLHNYPIYIVTDGNKLVQQNKLKTLGLPARVKFCFITHRYGLKHAKPSPYCFYKICAREKVRPEEVVYIGDNPNKDFVGIKPLGFRTVRVMQGQYRGLQKPSSFEAHRRVNSLAELTPDFLKLVFSE